MKARRLVGSADTEVDAYGFANLRRQGIFACECIGSPVKDIVLRVLLEQTFDALGQLPFGSVWLRRVELALHYIQLPVNGRQIVCRLDKDKAIHTVGDVMEIGRA